MAVKRYDIRKYIPYVIFGFVALFFSLSKMDKLRSSYVSLTSPLYKSMNAKGDKEKQALIQERDALLSYTYLLESKLEELSQEKPDKAISAKVIMRDPSTWGSAFWIDQGEPAVTANSPVVIGKALIGVIEKVEKNKSLVRLITDSSLTPSVRAVRGKMQQEFFLEKLALLKPYIFSENADTSLCSAFMQIESHFKQTSDTSYFAKGEVFGSSASLFRSKRPILHGVGFNYDFSDSEGPSLKKEEHTLIQEGDLLVTTGMDGVFPKGLYVGVVSKVLPPLEGAISYELEASLADPGLNETTYVFVMQ